MFSNRLPIARWKRCSSGIDAILGGSLAEGVLRARPHANPDASGSARNDRGPPPQALTSPALLSRPLPAHLTGRGGRNAVVPPSPASLERGSGGEVSKGRSAQGQAPLNAGEGSLAQRSPTRNAALPPGTWMNFNAAGTTTRSCTT